MKRIHFGKSLFLGLLATNSVAFAQSGMPVIQSNEKEIGHTINGKTGSWILLPDAKAAIWEVPVDGKQKT